jgi:hypothetical protein
MAEISFAVSTVGLVIPFVLTEYTGVSDVYGSAIYEPISYAQSCVVTWIANNGVRRVLTLNYPASAVFTYTISQFDYQAPRRELGQLQVSVGPHVFWVASTFTVNVFPHL